MTMAEMLCLKKSADGCRVQAIPVDMDLVSLPVTLERQKKGPQLELAAYGNDSRNESSHRVLEGQP